MVSSLGEKQDDFRELINTRLEILKNIETELRLRNFETILSTNLEGSDAYRLKQMVIHQVDCNYLEASYCPLKGQENTCILHFKIRFDSSTSKNLRIEIGYRPCCSPELTDVFDTVWVSCITTTRYDQIPILIDHYLQNYGVAFDFAYDHSDHIFLQSMIYKPFEMMEQPFHQAEATVFQVFTDRQGGRLWLGYKHDSMGEIWFHDFRGPLFPLGFYESINSKIVFVTANLSELKSKLQDETMLLGVAFSKYRFENRDKFNG